ncbi:hypothetical protein [Frankia sp. QA3]|uniref:hypothetical protein n=1 Tax=Frankia sp. QA3 TaxID=710111 RepID=UPI000269B8B9|nr:hypothetical protein [Frankia sp. QA3]EIV90822.1 hypothetical protein FraQA3DRAFT_0228 [Frankia sp. QA3]
MIILVDHLNPDRPPVQITIDDRTLDYDPVALARQLREAVPHAARVRWFRPGGSEDSLGGRSPAEILADVVDRLPPKRKPVSTNPDRGDDVP